MALQPSARVHRCFEGFRMIASAIALLSLLVASARVAHAQVAVQWIAMTGGNDHWYQRVTGPSEVSWLEADSAARAAGGHLVTVNSAEEASWIRSRFFDGQPVCGTSVGDDARAIWIGLRQASLAGPETDPGTGWSWVTNEPLINAAWAAGEPNDATGSASFAAMALSGGWDDLSFDAGDLCISAYVIEWSADCDGDGVVDLGQILAGELEDANANRIPDCCEGFACPTSDCNTNGHPDACELEVPGADSDHDLVLDVCERAFGDLDLDGVIGAGDLATLLSLLGERGVGIPEDIDGDGLVGAPDLAALLARWEQAAPWSMPVILSVSPSSGPVEGGATITITGRNLSGTTSVDIGEERVASFAMIDSETLRVVTSAGAPGLADVIVRTSIGVGSQAGAFRYVDRQAIVPKLVSISPPSGRLRGGTAVTITGVDVSSVTAVRIDGFPARAVRVVDSNTITAVTPKGTAGPKLVELVSPSGTTALNAGFTYLAPPRITSVVPGASSTAGGTRIMISGSNLSEVSSVTIGGVSATDISQLDPGTITFTAPPGRVGPQLLQVYTPGGVVKKRRGFTYVAPGLPLITAVAPSSGSVAGGTVVTINGENLMGTSSVRFGGALAASIVVLNAGTVFAVSPPGSAGLKSVSLTTPIGTANISSGFAYTDVVTPAWSTLIEALPDPAVVTNATLRSAIIKTGYAWRVRDNTTNIEMLLAPPGSFVRGCSPSDAHACSPEELPPHTVTLTSPFYIGRFEVTQAQWRELTGNNPAYFQPPNVASLELDRPVEQVSWFGVQSFVSQAGMRLPTEAEWEYCYRAGTSTAFHSGPGFPAGTNDDSRVTTIAWYSGNNGPEGSASWGTKRVGQLVPNALGIYDMSGNVGEWVSDRYSAYTPGSLVDPTGPMTGSYRIWRGGTFSDTTEWIRASTRAPDNPAVEGYWLGLRVARSP